MYKMESYIAGLMDGDGSIIAQTNLTGGYTLKVEFAQKKEVPILNQYFPSLYRDKRDGCCQYRVCGKKAIPILEIMKNYAIVKSKQAELALELLTYYKKRGTEEIRKEIANKIKKCNEDKESYEKPFTRINDNYIAGIFDAEGTYTFNKWKVQIVQAGCKSVLPKIQEHIGYGLIYMDEGRYRIWKHGDSVAFYDRFRPLVIIKANDMDKAIAKLRPA